MRIEVAVHFKSDLILSHKYHVEKFQQVECNSYESLGTLSMSADKRTGRTLAI